MKRKLDEHDVPQEMAEKDTAPRQNSEHSFVDLGLDARLLQAVVKEQYSKPTPVQAKAIPLALQGKDVLARAKTGSGKTAAYLLPILHAALGQKSNPQYKKCTSALILVPTRELASQVHKAVESLTTFCAKDIRAVNLTLKVPEAVQRSMLADSPDIVIATPARASSSVGSSALSLERLAFLVIDEADLVLSYGYDDDLQNVSTAVPKGVQTFLMSATLTNEIEILKRLFCRDPVVLTFEEEERETNRLSQYIVRCAEDEKFLLIYVIFKLKLVQGKCILFLADIDRCYRLKLYLEQFGIKSCVLNSELPVNSRIHVVEQFNKDVYDIIIATDEHEILRDDDDETTDRPKIEESTPAKKKAPAEEKAPAEDSTPTDEVGPAEENGQEQSAATSGGIVQPSKKKRRQQKRDKEYGVSRGIDFKNVACVLNFDLPSSSKSYTHRIGRTARAGKAGMALSFVIPRELYHKHKPTATPSTKHDDKILEKIMAHQSKLGHEVKPYVFDMTQVDAFRYRMNDALRAVTPVAVREARTRELRQELLHSEKLKRHFEENPGDLHHLRHDGELRAARIQPHLKHVPDYLLPTGGKKALAEGGADIGFVAFKKTDENRIRKGRSQKRVKGRGVKLGRGTTRKVDPLKTFRGKARG
ncbi:MAG: ATP-dependent DNA/RNA helicase [Piccolia ochrophora]|nr:MAG: ATP-dependent DNA/RNA helicase [Piccolia ochrophora]